MNPGLKARGLQKGRSVNFALEWIIQTPVFGQLRDIPGHDFFVSDDEMRQIAEKLKASPNVQQITYYWRENGIMKAIGTWDRLEASTCHMTE